MTVEPITLQPSSLGTVAFPNVMDPDVARWVLEFLLRSSVPDSVLKRIIVGLPLTDGDSRLKKTILLRTIQSQLSEASFTETLLETLEIIEALDRTHGIAIGETMKHAYCAVAVECTVRYLEASPDDKKNGLYFDAVKNIWRGRIGEMEAAAASGDGSGFFTDELIHWRDEIETALWDSKMSERLANMNTRRIAVNKVRDYLAEAWEVMGPSFLEIVASLPKVKNSQSLSGNNVSDAREEAATDRPDNNGDKGVCENPLAAEPRNMYEGRLRSSTNPREVLAASDRIDDSDNGAICAEEAPVTGGNQDSEQLDKRAMSSVDGNGELGGIDSPPKGEREILKGKLPLKRKHIAPCRPCRRYRGVKIIGTEEVDPATLHSKYDPVPSAEVKKVRESLKSSSLELQALVNDPLPDILHKSDIVRSELAVKGNSHEPPLANQSRDRDVPDPNACKGIVLYQPLDFDAIFKKKSSVQCSNVRRPNLMEWNSTAHTYEWDDSINNLPEGILRKRRRAKRWSSLEEETLKTGVEKVLHLRSIPDLFIPLILPSFFFILVENCRSYLLIDERIVLFSAVRNLTLVC